MPPPSLHPPKPHHLQGSVPPTPETPCIRQELIGAQLPFSFSSSYNKMLSSKHHPWSVLFFKFGTRIQRSLTQCKFCMTMSIRHANFWVKVHPRAKKGLITLADALIFSQHLPLTTTYSPTSSQHTLNLKKKLLAESYQ